MAAFIASLIFVVLAEMGDKTQLLAMAFATRYSAHKVLLAVFLATLINHALAVVAGHFLTTVIPISIISFVAACSFIIFGLWTIRGDKLEGEDKKERRFGPILTVGIAFFLAEMGDKTQLATISLAVKYQNMIIVLMGTTLGMVIADAFGIVIGVVMRKHIPDKTIKWISAIIFMVFGLVGVYKVLTLRLNQAHVWGIILLIGMLTIYAAYHLSKPNKK
ncbi:MAG: TMEM165/GDT1 family protein [Candidatus Omnitrophica bacterium]|nr:TMEM165/GDT1 family protein [Candidatus Omnitrophota bacterium]